MKKRILKPLAAALALLMLCACGGASSQQSEYTKYVTQFYDTFDTVVQVVGYAQSQEEFDGWAEKIHARFVELNDLYDRFYEHSGINNVATINKNAGVAPVEVAPELLGLVQFGLEWGEKTDEQINIALGPVLSVWHDYMETYAGRTDGEVPELSELEEKLPLCDPADITVDEANSTVYLEKPGMMLDVGAVAKGYAAEIVADEIYEAGFHSFIISAGGNVVTRDGPLDGVRTAWGIGIQDPAADPDDPNAASVDVLFVKNTSVVTSGDYQRYYFAGDRRIHHIIDPDTLQPADYYRSVTVVTEDSGMADCLSTALFCMDYERSRALAEKLDIGAVWVFADGTVEYTENLLPILRDRGGATNSIQK